MWLVCQLCSRNSGSAAVTAGDIFLIDSLWQFLVPKLSIGIFFRVRPIFSPFSLAASKSESKDNLQEFNHEHQ